MQTNKSKVKDAVKYMNENYKDHIGIDALAEKLNMSKFYFIRIFKNYAGIRPMQFAHFIMLNFAKASLKNSQNLLNSSYELGLSSPSRLHDIFISTLGITPNEFKNYGNELEIVYGLSQTVLGRALLACTHGGICLFSFVNSDENGEKYLARAYKNANLNRDDEFIKTNFDKFFKFKRYDATAAKLKTTNEQYMFWNAFLALASKIIKSGKSDARLKFILDAIPCCLEILKTNAFSNYRWGVAPKKHVLLYEPINFLCRESNE
jgi:transcriptional regulator, araC family